VAHWCTFSPQSLRTGCSQRLWTPQCAGDVVRVVVERGETVRDGHRASVGGVDVDVDVGVGVGVGVLGAARGVSSRVVAARERRARCARGRRAGEWR